MGKIRVLHIVSSLSKGSGVMSVIMNYYRHIDREKVQFDFMIFIDIDDSYINEIKMMGGQVNLSPNPKHIITYIRYLRDFFNNEANKYQIIHLHQIYLNAIIFPLAKKYNIQNRIAHSHATKYSDKRKNSLRNRILCVPIKKNADYLLACSKAAGIFLYGKKNF